MAKAMTAEKYRADWDQSDRDALDEMFRTARADGLWFYHNGISGPLWFSPDELQAEQAKGRFVWGAINWTLRDPYDGVALLDKKAFAALDEKQRMLDRIERWRMGRMIASMS